MFPDLWAACEPDAGQKLVGGGNPEAANDRVPPGPDSRRSGRGDRGLVGEVDAGGCWAQLETLASCEEAQSQAACKPCFSRAILDS